MSNRLPLRWAATREPPAVIYHATTPRKFERYKHTGCILAPVRGFDCPEAAREWAADKQGRTIILALTVTRPQLLPDHHILGVGAAWFEPVDVAEYRVCGAGRWRTFGAGAVAPAPGSR